jgi:hypothetical protein
MKQRKMLILLMLALFLSGLVYMVFAEIYENPKIADFSRNISRIDFEKKNNIKREGDTIVINIASVKVNEEITDIMNNCNFINEFARRIIKDSQLNKLGDIITINELQIIEQKSNFLKTYKTSIVVDYNEQTVKIMQHESKNSAELTLIYDITKEYDNYIEFKFRDFLLYNFINNNHEIFDRDVKISGDFKIRINQDDFFKSLFKGENIKFTNIDLRKIPFVEQLLSQLDFDVKERKIIVTTAKLDTLQVGNGEMLLTGVNIATDEFDINAGNLYWDNTNHLDGNCIFNLHKYHEHRKRTSPFVDFVKSRFETNLISGKISGHVAFPELTIYEPEKIYNYFIEQIENKKKFATNKAEYEKFVKEYDDCIKSNNPELAISALVAKSYLYDKHRTSPSWSSIFSKEDIKKIATDLKIKIDEFKDKFVDDVYYAILSNVENRIDDNLEEIAVDEVERILNFYTEIKKYNEHREKNTESLVDELLDYELKIVGRNVIENKIPALGVAYIALPVFDKATNKIVYEYGKKIITERNKEILKKIGGYAFRQSGNVFVGGHVVNGVGGFLEHAIHGTHATGHINMSSYLFGKNYKHIHQLIDMGGGWWHRYYNHDISTVFRIGRQFGPTEGLVVLQHHFQDFFTKDGIRILTPKGAVIIAGEESAKVFSKSLSISFVKLMNGARIVFFGLDTVRTSSEIYNIWQQHKITGIRKISIDFFSDKGIQTMNKQFARDMSKRLTKMGVKVSSKQLLSMSAIRATSMVSGVMNIWLAYSFCDTAKDLYHHQIHQKPLLRNIEANLLFNNFPRAYTNAKALYLDDSKNDDYLMAFFSTMQMMEIEKLELFPGYISDDSNKCTTKDFFISEYKSTMELCKELLNSSKFKDDIKVSSIAISRKGYLYEQYLTTFINYANFCNVTFADTLFDVNTLSTDLISSVVKNYRNDIRSYTAEKENDKLALLPLQKMNNMKSVIASNTIYLNSVIKISQFFPEIISEDVVTNYKLVLEETLKFIDKSTREMRRHEQHHNTLLLYETLLKKYPDTILRLEENDI